MNGGGSGFVEAVGGAAAAGARPLATLQALAEALGAMGAAQAHAAEPAAPAVDAAQAEAPALPEAVLPGGQALAAQQGRLTLGQLAAEQSLQRSASTEAPPSAADANPLLRNQPMADAVQAPRLPDAVAVPVMVSTLHTPPAGPTRAQQAEDMPRLRWPSERGPRDEQEDPAADHEAVSDTFEHEAAPAEAAEADPEALRLRAALERAGRSDALRELDHGRRVLLVLPQAGAALAWLFGPRRAQRHAARWWPGAAGVDEWRPWRVFRDGDPQLGRGLLSRAAGTPCRVRLGPQPPRLPDAGAASLEIAERIRFAQALGGQWSLLLLAAPAGWTP